MGYSKIVTPFVNWGLKLLGLAIPLTTLVLITVMTAQAYNEMIDLDFGGNIQAASSSVEIESGRLPQTALRGS